MFQAMCSFYYCATTPPPEFWDMAPSMGHRIYNLFKKKKKVREREKKKEEAEIRRRRVQKNNCFHFFPFFFLPPGIYTHTPPRRLSFFDRHYTTILYFYSYTTMWV